MAVRLILIRSYKRFDSRLREASEIWCREEEKKERFLMRISLKELKEDALL
jgi:hypothetical protein